MSHAKMFSPSKADGWFACPGRPTMEARYPETGSSADAADGTARHEVCAGAVAMGWNPDTYVGVQTSTGVTYQEDWVEEDQDYVDTIRALAAGADELRIEQAVDFSQWTGVPGDSFGTADAIIVRGRELIVADRKTGRVPVSPVRNRQAMLYALGAYAEFGMLYEFDTVRIVIHQRHAAEWACTVDELLAFGEEVRVGSARVLKAVKWAEIGLDADWLAEHLNPTPTESACAYCSAMAQCPSMRAAVAERVKADFDLVETVEDRNDLAQAYADVGMVEDWCKAVRAAALAQLQSGQGLPGYKLVLGRAGNRAWADEAQAEEMLRKRWRLPIGKAYSLKLISPTAAEKLAKAGDIGARQWAAAQGLITRSAPKPAVAPADDPRDAYIPANDFPELA